MHSHSLGVRFSSTPLSKGIQAPHLLTSACQQTTCCTHSPEEPRTVRRGWKKQHDKLGKRLLTLQPPFLPQRLLSLTVGLARCPQESPSSDMSGEESNANEHFNISERNKAMKGAQT